LLPYLLVLALGLIALVQVSLLPALALSPASPDPMLVVVVAWGVFRGVKAALVWALIGGLWLDLLSSGPFGAYTLGLLTAALIAGFGSGAIYRSHILLALVLVALATLAQDLVQFALLWITQQALSLPDALAKLALPEVLFNAILMLIMYPILSWVDKATGRERLPLE
jgi:rod shape-determining protein MreD